MSTAVVAPAPAADRAILDKSLFWGLAYTGGVKWLTQILAWASTLVVARLLAPDDYGLVGMAAVYIGLVTLINEFGLGIAIITKRELTEHELAQLNTLSVAIGLTALAISWGGAIPLAHFFGAPPLRWVVVTMSLGFLISGFQTVPTALLQRELQFKWLALLEAYQAIIIGASMILLALIGFGYWTLVLGNLLGTTFLTAMVVAKRSHRFAWPRLRELRPALAFSSHILVGRLAWYVQANADFLVAGRVLGQRALGVYSVGWTLASVPVDKVSSIAARVTPAFFSAVQTDRAALRRYLLVLTEALALITIPLAWGLALVADEVVLLVLGEKWQAVTGPLRILAVVASLRAVVTLLSQVLNATGHSRFSMYKATLDAILLSAAFWVGSGWGIVGIAAAWLTIYPLLVVPVYWFVFRNIAMPPAQYLRVIWPALSGALVMAAAVITLKLVLPPTWELPLRFLIEVSAGAGVYLAILLVWHRERLGIITQRLVELRSQTES